MVKTKFKKEKSEKFNAFTIVTCCVLCLYCIALFIPIVWGIITSFKDAYEFDVMDDITWERFENFCKLISGKSNIFYGTNKEVLTRLMLL